MPAPPLARLAEPGPWWGVPEARPGLNSVVSQAQSWIAARMRAPWPRRTVAAVVLLAVGLAAGLTWLKVARTIRHPDPVAASKQPRVTALAWSGRVFVDAASFKRWLEARDVAYAAWARQHPRAEAVLERTRARGR